MAWQRIAARSGGSVVALAVTPTDPNVVFAATAVGVFRSCDGGQSWSLPEGASQTALAEALAVSPDAPGVVFAGTRHGLFRSTDNGENWHLTVAGSAVLGIACAADGLVVAATENDGVLRSEDNGQTWSGANAGLLDLTALCAALSSDGSGFLGTTSGLYRTRNRARSWRSVDIGSDDEAVQCMAIGAAVLAGTETAGLLRSADGGSTWQAVLGGSITAIACSGTEHVVAASESGIAVSHDAGQTLRVLPAPGDILSLAVHSGVLLAGLAQRGIAHSGDDGVTWRAANDGLHARAATALAIASDGTLVEGSIEDGISVSHDRGATWHSVDIGDVSVLGLTASGATIRAATTDGLWLSHDAGATWQRVAGAEDPPALRTRPGPPDAEVIATATADAHTLFVATRGQTETVLWRSVDGGQAWHRWLVQPLATMLPIAVSPSYAIDETVFVANGNIVLKPRRGTRETRGGESWPLWHSVALPGASAVTSLAASPAYATDHTVVAATNAGAFISRDGGETFKQWSEQLQPRGVVALAMAPDESICALTVGGALWERPLTDE